MKRVLFPFVGDTVGGSHISTLELALGLDGGRFEGVVSVHKEGPLRTYLKDRNVVAEDAPDWRFTPFSENPLRDPIATLFLLPRLVWFLRRLRIDIVHTNDARMHYIWGMAARLSGVKFVLHLRALKQSRIGISSRFADSIIAITEYTKEKYPPKIKKKSQVIPNPVRPPAFGEDRGSFRKRMLKSGNADPRTEVIVGYVSNFMQRKRPVVFVETAARLRDRFGNRVFFVMFGETDGARDEGIRKEVTAKIAEYGLTSRCVLMGPRYPIEPWIMGLDVLVAPALGEPFGRTLVEAMLCCTPVVAADDGGHRDIIHHGKTGLLVPPDDAAAFANAAAELLEHQRTMSVIAAAAKADALKRFSVEAHVERVQRVYDLVLQ